jgi:hypothetical protein
MVAGFTTTYAIIAYHHWCYEFESRSGVQQYVKFVSDLRQVGGGQFYWRRKPEYLVKTTDLSQVTDKLHIMLHTWSRFELTTLVMIGTDCIGSCKSNYHTITATTTPGYDEGKVIWQVQYHKTLYLLNRLNIFVLDYSLFFLFEGNVDSKAQNRGNVSIVEWHVCSVHWSCTQQIYIIIYNLNKMTYSHPDIAANCSLGIE